MLTDSGVTSIGILRGILECPMSTGDRGNCVFMLLLRQRAEMRCGRYTSAVEMFCGCLWLAPPPLPLGAWCACMHAVRWPAVRTLTSLSAITDSHSASRQVRVSSSLSLLRCRALVRAVGQLIVSNWLSLCRPVLMSTMTHRRDRLLSVLFADRRSVLASVEDVTATGDDAK